MEYALKIRFAVAPSAPGIASTRNETSAAEPPSNLTFPTWYVAIVPPASTCIVTVLSVLTRTAASLSDHT